MTSAGKRFTVLQRFLHWLMAICILAMLFIGVGMNSTVAPKYVPLLATHKTLGATILVLALIRLAVRLRYGAPPLPADLPEPMKLGAHLSHQALYVLMIALPLLGLTMQWTGAYPIVLYGDIRLPSLLPQSDAMHTLLWDFSRSSCSMSQQRCSTRLSGGTACSRAWRPRPRTTRRLQ
jgi:cytochrome b561